MKSKMIKRLLANENLLWKPTMEAIIGILNLDLFLRSNFPVPKNTSNFYTAVLKSWKEFKYETFNSKEDILNQYLWYNEKLKISNKTKKCMTRTFCTYRLWLIDFFSFTSKTNSQTQSINYHMLCLSNLVKFITKE